MQTYGLKIQKYNQKITSFSEFISHMWYLSGKTKLCCPLYNEIHEIASCLAMTAGGFSNFQPCHSANGG